MEEWESDGEVACELLVGIQLCRRLDKNGVRRIRIPKMPSMIAFKNCVWLVGLRSVEYRLSVVGFIASRRSDGLFVCCY